MLTNSFIQLSYSLKFSCMKKALTKWYNYLISIGLVAIIFAIGFIPFILINNDEIWPKVYISYVALLSGVIYAGVGFIVQDIYRGFARKKTKNWDYPLEDCYIEKAWAIYMPLLLAAVICVLSGLISYLFLK